MPGRVGSLLAVIAVCGVVAGNAAAQSSGDAKNRELFREQVNEGVVRLIAGEVSSTSLRFADDLATVLDGKSHLRILPTIGRGAVQNITDILFLKGIDLCIVQADALDYVERNGIHAGTAGKLRYITKLHNEELHLLAGPNVRRFADLAGRKVGVGPQGSGSQVTATTAFEALEMRVQPVFFDHGLALEKLKEGEIAAIAYVTGKPAPYFHDVSPAGGLHFVSVPATPKLLGTYAPAQLRHEDYPHLIAEGTAIETLAVGAVMAVYHWPAGSERYDRAERFVRVFFESFEEFLRPPRHPKWQEVNLAATVPGWTRSQAAQDWLDWRALAGGAEEEGSGVRAAYESFLQFMRSHPSQAGSHSGSTPEFPTFGGGRSGPPTDPGSVGRPGGED
jgi:TRAP transporter TAXI family solute receptor